MTMSKDGGARGERDGGSRSEHEQFFNLLFAFSGAWFQFQMEPAKKKENYHDITGVCFCVSVFLRAFIFSNFFAKQSFILIIGGLAVR